MNQEDSYILNFDIKNIKKSKQDNPFSTEIKKVNLGFYAKNA
jgi:hypothetical protein